MLTARTVPDLLRVRAAEVPHQPAMVLWGGRTMTFSAWDAAADSIAHTLVSSGVRQGERVGVVTAPTAADSFAAAYLGVQRAGAVAVALAPNLPPEALKARLSESGAVAVFHDAGLSQPPDAGPMAWLDIRDVIASPAPGPVHVDVGEDSPADVVYTSGTEGRSRGVVSTHRSLLSAGAPSAAWRGATLLHAIGSATAMGAQGVPHFQLRGGMTAAVVPVFDRRAFVDAASATGAAVALLVPSMARVLLDADGFDGGHLSSLRYVMLFGDRADERVLAGLKARLPDVQVLVLYGLTEAGTAQTVTRYDGRRPGSVGKPVGSTAVRVVDETGAVLPACTVGELWVRGQGTNGRSYIGEEPGFGVFRPGGWVRTGDLGYLDEAGYLYLVDRAKDIAIVSGQNVATSEVEDALRAHTAVADVAVFAVPHDAQGEEVAAAIVIRGGVPLSKRDVRRFLLGRLPVHMVPTRLFTVSEIPRNAMGKPTKHELRDLVSAGALAEV